MSPLAAATCAIRHGSCKCKSTLLVSSKSFGEDECLVDACAIAGPSWAWNHGQQLDALALAGPCTDVVNLIKSGLCGLNLAHLGTAENVRLLASLYHNPGPRNAGSVVGVLARLGQASSPRLAVFSAWIGGGLDPKLVGQ